MSKLIILRGPSGAGKSTVAEMLHARAANKTGLFEQDSYRHRIFNNPHSDLEVARLSMFAGMLAALEYGADVIAEGILSKGKYKPYFDRLLQQHSNENYFFYFDVSFEETERRHAMRDKSQDFSAETMREWYDRAAPYGYDNEQTISEGLSAEQACELIIAVTGLAVAT